ncbi:hypothetical protein [Sphingomonas sp. CLY1604]|uniref:hypothetical protein n=1 Tax=Sphingomonas sp. CLY1604 TaxID=3457786 RepID=UPI003FD89036
MFLALVLGLAGAMQSPAVGSSCGEESRILNEDIATFDQDPQRGWRSVASQPGCRTKAAELIRIYREMLQMRIDSLVWHEGQILAELGRTSEAIVLFQRAKRPTSMLGQSQDAWNTYADATIAFLKHDLAALKQARQRLAALPAPTIMQRQPDGTFQPSLSAGPPPNLDVVDGLITCFDRSYAEAYGSSSCRKNQ